MRELGEVGALDALRVLRAAQAQALRLCQTESPRYDYRLALTRLILEKTARGGEPVALVRHAPGPDPSQDRCLDLLRTAGADVSASSICCSRRRSPCAAAKSCATTCASTAAA